jgi:hypothetical protein
MILLSCAASLPENTRYFFRAFPEYACPLFDKSLAAQAAAADRLAAARLSRLRSKRKTLCEAGSYCSVCGLAVLEKNTLAAATGAGLVLRADALVGYCSGSDARLF